MLETFKALTGCDNDTIANYFLDKATTEIKDYTKRNTKTVTTTLKSYVIELAIGYYNRKGTEGLKSQSYDGVSESYLNGMPRNIKAALNSYKRFEREVEVDEHSEQNEENESI